MTSPGQMNPVVYRRRRVDFKNCTSCGAWKRVNRVGQCESCSAVDSHLHKLAKDLLRDDPDLKPKDVAESLGIEEDRVSKWIHERRLKPRTFEKKCPNCGRIMVNRFTCDSCHYGKPPDPPPERKQFKRPTGDGSSDEPGPRRASKIRAEYWDHYSQISKKNQIRRLLLVPNEVAKKK